MKKIAFLILTFAIILSSINAFALTNEITIDKKIERISDAVSGTVSQIIKISGTTTDKYANKKINVVIVRPGIDLNDTTKTDVEKFAYVSMDYVGKDNKYLFEIPFNDVSDTYEIRIMADGLSIPVTTTLFVPTVTGINNLIKSLKDKTITAEELDGKLCTDYTDLGIDVSIYSQLNYDVRIAICNSIISKFDTYTIEYFEELFYQNTMYFGLNSVKDIALYKNILNFYEDTLKLSNTEFYGEFEKLENKDNVYNYMMQKNNYRQLSDVEKEFTDGICSLSLKELVSYTNFEGCFDIFDTYMQLESYYDAYIVNIYKDEISSYIVNNIEGKKTLEEVKSLIKTTIDNAPVLFMKPPVIIQGGGGGGGGTSSVKVSDTIIKEEVLDEKQEEKPEHIFNDVDENHWAKEPIDILYEKGIVSGREENKFFPELNVTREEFVKLVCEALEFTDENAKCDFYDVSVSDWSYKYIASLKEKGFINGISQTEFGASNYITRQDAACIIYNCIKDSLETEENNLQFSDFIDVSDYAKVAVDKLSYIKVISGFPDGSFMPKENITRAQGAQIIYNLLKHKEGK